MNTPATGAGAHDRYYIGGGNIAGILGLSPFKTPLEEFDTILGQGPAPSAEKLEFFKRRKSFEPVAAEIFQSETGLEIVDTNMRYQHAGADFIKAEIDAETADGENVEIKTVHPYAAADWGEAWTDDFPDYVAAQAIHGLAVTERLASYVMAMIGFDDVRIYRVERDDESCEQIIAVAKSFWEQHILPRIPPSPRTTADILRLWPRDDGSHVVASSDVAGQCAQLKRLKAEIKEASVQQEELEKSIKGAIGEAAELITPNGTRLATWKAQTASRVNIKALRASRPDIANKFSIENTTRVFRLK